MLIEKAWAKGHGSYERIITGQSYEALRDFLGAPAYYYKVNEENAVNVIRQAYENKYIITATSEPNPQEKKKLMTKGILTLQSYSLIRIEDVPDHDGNTITLIQLRNPWGCFEWNGDYGDESKTWSEEAKKICNLQVADDGFFWMNFKDF